jgi:hypothetical protein
MRTLIISLVTALVALASPLVSDNHAQAYADVIADNGGGLGAGEFDPPIVVDAGWSATTVTPPGFLLGWSGRGFNIEGPFTFTSVTAVTVRVTDDFCKGDRFRIFDFGVPIGDTSVAAVGPCVEVGPDAAFADPGYSSGSFNLGPGPHAISIQVIVTVNVVLRVADGDPAVL